MERKIKKLEKFMTVIGLTWDDIGSYLQQKEQSNNSELKTTELVVVNPEFPADDIRSRTKLFWYAFEGKKFSPDPEAYPNCQGVVGWINPDKDAPEGDKIYVVLPELEDFMYSDGDCEVGGYDLFDGKSNTRKMIEYEKIHLGECPAARYAYNYTKNGVKKGEAFWPASEQLVRLCKYDRLLEERLKKIGGKWACWLLSSTECDNYCARQVDTDDCGVCCFNKHRFASVVFILSY